MLSRVFVDLNSYFASVEQQERPELRGKPVAIVPVETDSTSCIAASYEAKAFGVKTGTRVGDARRMCPDLLLVRSRHRVYIEYHHRILAAADTVLPVEQVHSIDEFSCRLKGTERQTDTAVELARRLKRAIALQVGECLRCSIGIAPNRFLAKVASDMQKPDGLVVIDTADLPGALEGLDLTDLPGLGPRKNVRLRSRGVHTVAQLCALDENAMYALWGSIVGRFWFHYLRGNEVGESPTHRRSISHQHVLPPALRTPEGARSICIKLLHKAASRARSLGYCARRLSLNIKHIGAPPHRAHTTFHETSDTLSLVEAFASLWGRWKPATPLRVGVALEDLVPRSSATLPLFAQDARRAKLSQAMDAINRKLGRDAVYLGVTQDVRQSAPTRIAFNHIPDLSLPETSGTDDELDEGAPGRHPR
ncbi:MAG: DNA polymerase [Planctomycetota bacterium]|nr:DNA polymerase [Planctomycetota bacterium]